MRLRALFDRKGTESELDEEVRFHLEQQTAMYVRAGLSPEEARRRARLDFGSVDATKETHRDQRGTRGLEDLVGDMRYALRSLWRDRALAVAGALTLALGIGATTAVFSAVNAVLLRDLPFREPDRLVEVWEENSDRGWYKNVVAPANMLDWKQRASGFEDIAGYTDYSTSVTLIGFGEPQLINSTNVTGNFLSVLGVTPLLGRGLEPADDWEDGQRSVMISHRLWKSLFKSDSAVIGTSVTFGGQFRPTIVAVLPEGFAFPSPSTDVFLPMRWARNSPQQIWFRRAHWMRAVARLKPGISHDEANASLQTVVRQLQTEYPQTNTRMGAGITALHEFIVGNTKRPLVVLLAAAGVLLLIACANVGNLLLLHALGRSRDISLRFALGATRGRVARQALTESLTLSFVGGALGLALGWAGARALLALQPTGMLPVTDVSVDYRVLAFTVALTTISGLLFGLAPTLNATRQAPAEALNAGGSRTVTGGRVRRWGRQLVTAEVALAALLTVGAGLLLRSYEKVSKIDPGFVSEGVLTFGINIPPARYDSASRVMAFYSTLLERIDALPGVEYVAATRNLPATVTSWTANLAVEGRPPMEQSTDIIYRPIFGDYFSVMRVKLLKGRAFSAADTREAVQVAIINDVMARQFFPTEDPIGRRIAPDRVPDSTTIWRTVVGVVSSERQASLTSPARAEVFLPMPQNVSRSMQIAARVGAGRDPVLLAQPVRRVVRDLDSLLAISDMQPMTTVHRAAMSRERFTSALVLVFAVTGIVLAIVGVFGALAQMVQARWREMGIRLALGAQQSQVRWFIVAHGLRLLGIGVGVGLGAALLSTRVLAALLYEIRPTDAVTYLSVGLLIVVVGLMASWIPARRASTADPALSLRAE
jgi:predicted permease